MEVANGLPIIINNAEGLEEYGLTEGQQGDCSAVMSFPETGEDIVGFRPLTEHRVYFLNKQRVEVDTDRLESEKSNH